MKKTVKLYEVANWKRTNSFFNRLKKDTKLKRILKRLNIPILKHNALSRRGALGTRSSLTAPNESLACTYVIPGWKAYFFFVKRVWQANASCLSVFFHK